MISTLSKYIIKLYIKYLLVLFFILITLLTISNTFDILQKFKTTQIPLYLLWKLILYKTPYLTNKLAPFISFVGTICLLYRLYYHLELQVMLCSGMHMWRIVAIPIVMSFLFGILIILILNPIGANGLKQYKHVESKILKKSNSDIMIIPQGMFFFEESQDNNKIVHTKSIDLQSRRLNDIITIFVDKEYTFLKRIDAKYANFGDDNTLNLFEANFILNNDSKYYPEITIKTNLSINKILNSFIPPEMLSLWNLNRSIKLLTKLGLPTSHYTTYYYTQLLKPFIMMTMATFACCFIMFIGKYTNIKMLSIVLISGFIVYVFIEIGFRLFVNQSIHPILAMMLPCIFIMCISNFIILHLY
ncbi:MAG: LptF/LptG family permease [Rickettsiaceae bacterium]